MATALTPSDRALNATDGKDNFQRLTRLLVCGGVTLLREVFDAIHPPTVLSTKLGDPYIKGKLQGLRHRSILTKPEWNQLYPSPGVYGKSKDFDITLLFKLIRTICNLTPPGTDWDGLPNMTDLSLEADLVRIKFYRNHVCHSNNLEISDSDFSDLWREISETLLRIAGSISNVRRVEWQKSIKSFLQDPLTRDAESDREELNSWYKNDMVVKEEFEKFRNEMQKMINVEQQELKNIIIRIFTETFTQCRSGSYGSVITQHLPNTPQRQEALLQPDSVCVPIFSQDSQTEGAADWQSPDTQLQANRETPSTVLDFWQVVVSFKRSVDLLIEYLKIKLGLEVVDNRLGSLLITVTCSSLEVLEGFWEDYSSGHLSEVVQETLVTPEVLSELDLSEVTLKTIILEDEYKSLKTVLKNRSDTLKQQNSDETSTGGNDDNDESEGSDEKHTLQQQTFVPRTNTKDSGCSFGSDDSGESGDINEKDTLQQQTFVPRTNTKDSGCSFGSDDSGESGDINEKGRDYTAKITVDSTVAAFPPETKKKSSGYLAFSLEPLLFMDCLPYWSRHDLIKTLDSPYRFPNWRNLAEELSIEERHIQWLEELPPSSSPTYVLLRMMEAQNYPLGELAETLRELGRDDAANIIEEHLDYWRETSTTYEGYDTKL